MSRTLNFSKMNFFDNMKKIICQQNFPYIFLYIKCFRKNWKSHFVFRKTCLKEVSSYNDKVSSYNDKVPSYNDKVPSYNNKVPSNNDKVSSYNNKVPSYNDKVPSYNDKVSSYKKTSHHKAVMAFHRMDYVFILKSSAYRYQWLLHPKHKNRP